VTIDSRQLLGAGLHVPEVQRIEPSLQATGRPCRCSSQRAIRRSIQSRTWGSRPNPRATCLSRASVATHTDAPAHHFVGESVVAVRVHVPGAGIGRSCRYSVDRETPSAWATSTIGVPSVIILVACLRLTGLSTVGRPPRRPRARAAASPA